MEPSSTQVCQKITKITKHYINKKKLFNRWCVRHLYKPLVTAGNSRTTATIIVFATSAFFHEYLISVPLRLFKIWGFLGMLVQAPLFPVSKFIEKHFGPRLGNVFVWISLILGKTSLRMSTKSGTPLNSKFPSPNNYVMTKIF